MSAFDGMYFKRVLSDFAFLLYETLKEFANKILLKWLVKRWNTVFK